MGMQHTKFKNFRGIKQQALMVQTVDSAIHWINHCLVDKYQGNQYIIQWIDIYLEQLVSDVLASSALPGETVTTFLLTVSILNQEKMQ